jgi:CRISPR/Cas system-associated exonuclease Cas4 (RecB family)
MKLDTYIDKQISKVLLAENAKRDAEHVSSGKLSASMLGWPLQWMVLKNIGVPQKPIDEYTLRKFQRGNHVEDYVVGHLSEFLVEKQKKVEYRGVVGYVDAFVDTTNWDFPSGKIPLEVKSVTNMKYKRISQRKSPDRGHLLQAALYALALETPQFGIVYVASDDYRIRTTIHATEDFRGVIDDIIDRYDKAMEDREIPEFILPTPEDKWYKNPTYCNFPDFISLSGESAKAKAKELAGNKYKWL